VIKDAGNRPVPPVGRAPFGVGNCTILSGASSALAEADVESFPVHARRKVICGLLEAGLSIRGFLLQRPLFPRHEA
jgi:hypothetical protein